MTPDTTLFISADEYDYHSIRKIALTNGYLGDLRIFDGKDENGNKGYVIIFKNCPISVEDSIGKFNELLEDLKYNRFTR